MIQFICPNGHQLSAPDDRAGKPGKCPKCGTAFVVPELDLPDDEHGQESPVSESPSEATPPAESQDELFFFLCPNGHKLNGPPSLKGRPGQCPHCGAKFRIPADDEEEEGAEEGAEEIPVGSRVEDDGEEVEMVEEVEIVDDLAVAPPPVCGHPLGDLLMQLWEQQGEGRIVELTLRDKQVISSDLFSPSLSGPQFGVFVTEYEGEQAITVVAWEDVARFHLRNLTELPERLFH